MVVTAGDLIRRALEEEPNQLGLAKRLAGSKKDTDPEVRRWRYVVMRAAGGSEPNEENVSRIVDVLGRKGEQVERRPRRERELSLLEGVAAEVARLEESQAQIHEKLDALSVALLKGFQRPATGR